ncbi:hypothetical protein AB6A40_008429 [Gnathostoma spinigerum]|uniref:Amino acid transporter n=1 Tax=Gnathostoma spinigerum TaxID=75299 RepID=A0ABD6EZH6_9BILA
MGIMSWVNFYSLKKYAGRVQIIDACAKVLALVFIIVTGFYFMIVKGRTEHFTGGNLFAGSKWEATHIVHSIYGGVWAYSGYQVLNYGAEDVRKIRRSLIISAIGGISFTIFIYLLTNIGYFVILTPSEVLGSNAVAGKFAEVAFGRNYYVVPIVTFIVGILMVGAQNSDVFMWSRYIFAGARRGQMPTCWALIHEESGSPRVAIIFHFLFSFAFSFLDNVQSLISYTIVSGMLQQIFAVSGLLWIRISGIPVSPGAVRFPLVFPIILWCISVCLVIVPAIDQWITTVVGVAVLCAFLIIYFILKWISPCHALIWLNYQTTVFFQKLLFCTVAKHEESYYHPSSNGNEIKKRIQKKINSLKFWKYA